MKVLCIGQRVTGIELALEIAHAFLKAEYDALPRHNRRLEKIGAIENENLRE
jgi:ribose 5-phosphate isomerase B